jgi:acyl-homoserine-lactone acylase
MKAIPLFPCLIFLIATANIAIAQDASIEVKRWNEEATQVTIIRDTWGIPHVYGKTDADAVFGLLYAECEDDFKRVEMNYVEKLGRLAEINGETDLYNDLLMRLVIDSADAIKDFDKAPDWLRKLCQAFADGINYYLFKHPETKPALLHHFEPWYPLLWTDGSIGAISTAGMTANDLRNFYSPSDSAVSFTTPNHGEESLTGSNGFAFGPSITASHHAILYINPHVTLYFRPEVQMVSDEGLNVYGAVTWGQFFIYQGFNEHCAWMHTSSAVDVSDTYLEKMKIQNGQWFYAYENESRPVIKKDILINVKENGSVHLKKIAAYFTHHGPVMGKLDSQWISVRSYNRSLNGLMQCWLRTKTTSFASFKKVLELRGNTSNNTVYADAEGNIAYWHGNFIPVRDLRYNWSKPVDGSIAATEWKGGHSIDEIIHVYNPPNGWLQNCNSSPFSVAGKNSPKKEDYPTYMAPDGENFRAVNAVRILAQEDQYTMDKVIAKGYDTYLSAFEQLIPALVRAYHNMKPEDSLYALLQEPVSTLENWDKRSGVSSIATNLAVEWGQKLLPLIVQVRDSGASDLVKKTERFALRASEQQLLIPLWDAVNSMKKRWGSWDIAWGEINRYQRNNGALHEKFDDKEPSIPVGFTSSLWGQIPSFASKFYPGTKKRYGVDGNSFICVVEFGKKIRARSLLAGGESGDPSSKHFSDQALMYSKGEFKEVNFYKEDVLQHAEKKYHPGE